MGVRLVSLDGEWQLAVDPNNVGIERKWWQRPEQGQRPARVPGIIQGVFPAYHGVAWYRRKFRCPRHPDERGRFLLRFWAVDYLCDVWLNGVHIGGHEGGETPFELDATDSIKPGGINHLAVRVLNPTNDPIDGMTLGQTPHRNKSIPPLPGSSYNYGGITESVELLLVPAVRVEDVFVRPDIKTGGVRVQVTVRNFTKATRNVAIQICLSPAAGGITLTSTQVECRAKPEDTVALAELRLDRPRLWQLHDPYLYSATVRLWLDPKRIIDERSVRFGFRDFRVVNGFFHLNGKRIFLKSAHTGNHCPIGQIVSPAAAPDLLQRDLIYAKACGLNAVRFIAGAAHPWQLDLCDEIGLMVYEESLASWCLEDSPNMAERFDRSVAEMIRRDRNHPSVVIWGLLNETRDGPVFRHAVEALKLVRSLDDTRLVLLGSGRWDGQFNIGSVSNPGSDRWECVWGMEDPSYSTPFAWGSGGYAKNAGDAHIYPSTPQTPEANNLIRTLGKDAKPVFLSEYGIGSLLNAIRELRFYEQAKANPELEDACLMRSMAESLIADWKRLGMQAAYPFPEDMLRDSQRLHCRQRLLGFDLIRSNPKICGFNVTGMLDHGMTGEGLWTFWREWKPGIADALSDGWAPLRWCTFVEPMHGYSGQAFRIEVVLANEDVLPAGKYPVTVKIFGPDGPAWEKHVLAHIPTLRVGELAPLALTILLETVVLKGPPGRYELRVSMDAGGAPAGGRLTFYLSDPRSLPRVKAAVGTWGIDERVTAWLRSHGVSCQSFPSSRGSTRVILVGDPPANEKTADNWRTLAGCVARGAVAIFTSPKAFRRGEDGVGWLPLPKKGRYYEFGDWLYHKECVARPHPILQGLPDRGTMDWDYYGPVIPHGLFADQETPDEVVAAAFALGYPCPGGYASGILVGVYRFGQGRFIVNTLNVLDNLDAHPTADRILLNMVSYASQNALPSPSDLPPGFERLLADIGYE